MADETLLRGYKLDTLNAVLPSAFDLIEVNVEYIIYNTLFLKECLKDFKETWDSVKRSQESPNKEKVIKEITSKLNGKCVAGDEDELIKESHNAINDSLDGLREILRSIKGLRGFMEVVDDRCPTKEVVDINNVLVDLILALKQQWHPNSELSMQLDVKCQDIDDPSLRVKSARTSMTPQKKWVTQLVKLY